MKIINANIYLYQGRGKRALPIKSGYRPLFQIIKGKYLSGSIKIINMDELKPGEKGIAEVTFINDHLIEICEGKIIYFSEGQKRVGEIRVLETIKKKSIRKAIVNISTELLNQINHK